MIDVEALCNIQYAATTVALRDRPCTQCTRTTPPELIASWMKRHALGRWMRRSA